MTDEAKELLQRQMNNPDIKTIGDVSDGYHTFNSLYNQRLYLWAALVKAYKDKAWKTRRHSDGKPCFDGNWFLVGITTPAGDYTYHYELKDWDLFDCKELDCAPPYDGHTDADVTRVLTLQPAAHPNWISAKDELPPKQEGHEISELYNCYNGEFQLYCYYDYRDNMWHESDGGKWNITHWIRISDPGK